MVLLHSWQIGDRVYSTKDPDITGTVIEVLPHSCLVKVRPDGGWFDLIYPSAEIEWFTRPPLKSSHTRHQ